MRWDDYLHQFCWYKWPHLRDDHWFDILTKDGMRQYEEEFVAFVRAQYAEDHDSDADID